ncbi:MAG: phosphoribosylformylglycinamidine synthase subunit PurS [Candidatus Kaelpia aquatica]|nr:phosphoribosylformylglycinamidine synthase subunit PurS [Candidatus Kaelpia aquatica]
MLKADITVHLKKTVVDPQGLAVKHALESLDYESLKEVRVGKSIAILFDSDDVEDISKKTDEICKKLLANTVIEDYQFSIKKEV